MREAVHRFTAPLLAKIPDISRQPTRRRAAIGLGASILVHLVILLLMIILTSVIPEHVDLLPAAKKGTIDLVVMPPAQKKLSLAPPMPKTTTVIDARGMQASKEKPLDPKFESDRDMVEASEAPTSGFLPLPSQEGRTDRNSHDFANQEVRLGLAEPGPSAPPAAAAPPSPDTAQQQTATAANSMPPLYDPNPVAREKLQEAEHATPNQKLPEPAKPRATPPPLKQTAAPSADEIAVATPSTETKPGPLTKVETAEETPVKPAMRTSTTTPKYETASLATPKPFSGPSVRERYQENLQKTRVEGNISNRGKAGVSAVATPLGRYYGQIGTALGSTWNLLVNERRSLIDFGTAKFTFHIGPDGKVSDVHMESNTANAAFASMCEEAVRRAPIPSIPADLIPSIRDGGLDYSTSFTMYPY